MTNSVVRVAYVLLASASFFSCKDVPAGKPSTAAQNAPTPKADDSAAGSIDLGATTPYSTTTLSAVGSIAGTLQIADSTSVDDSAAANDAECAPRGRGPAPASAKTFANTVVWVANAKAGKPMPIEKRAELSSERCALEPRVQAVTIGTTVNVINDDKILHRLVFLRLGTNDTLVVTPFFNTGQIVATEQLAKKPGIIEVRCVQHPWTRGYIAVFDHPYFAVTENNGTFGIDSLPAGNYRMMIWHEGAAKPTEQQVQVSAGGTATVTR